MVAARSTSDLSSGEDGVHKPEPQSAPPAHVEISTQAARTPQSIAVQSASGALTYADLEARACDVAACLRARSIGPSDRVGVCLRRGPGLLPALLGVLKSGAAYVPLDPDFPAARLQYMCVDAGLKAVLTEHSLAALPAIQGAPRILIEEVVPAGAANELPEVRDDSPAYVIYTSGSTGQPKGVMVPHRAVSNLLASMRREPGISAEDRLLAVTTLSFDIAVLELFLPLTAGATVVLASRDEAMDGRALARLIEHHQITVMQATPATWHLLLAAGWRPPQRFRALCGGEAMQAALAARLLAQVTELWNMYGPTETTVWSTLARITDAADITVGRPILNTSVHLLDEHQRAVAEGEICIGGTGVALGYWNRPDLTGARFIADPFRNEPGATLYRTGDLGRMDVHGRLVHLGRLDQQVKVRGYRIEPGEIETHLMRVPGISQAVVVARELGPGDVRLLGYFVGSTERSAGLKAELRKTLPEYMVPDALVSMTELPRLPNGKIDRAALPLPEVASPPTSTTQLGSSSPTERTIAAIWRTLLRVAHVDASSHFFELGGHSLLAVRMLAALERELSVSLPLSVLARHPTCGALAVQIDSQRDTQNAEVASAGSEWQPLVLLRQGHGRTPLFCVHAVGGNVLNYRQLANSLPVDQPVYALQAVGLDGITPPLESIEEMATRYIAAMRQVQPHGPYYLCGGSMGGTIAFEIARQLTSAGERVALLAMLDTWGPDMRRAGSVRLTLGQRLRRLLSPVYLLRRLEDRVSSARARRLIAEHRRIQRVIPQDLRWRAVTAANVLALSRYVEGPYSGRITLICATSSLARGVPNLGWDSVAAGGIDRIVLDGRHDTFVEQPEVVRALEAALMHAQTDFEPAWRRATG